MCPNVPLNMPPTFDYNVLLCGAWLGYMAEMVDKGVCRDRARAHQGRREQPGRVSQPANGPFAQNKGQVCEQGDLGKALSSHLPVDCLLACWLCSFRRSFFASLACLGEGERERGRK